MSDRKFRIRREGEIPRVDMFTTEYPLQIFSFSPRFLAEIDEVDLLEEEYGDGRLWMCSMPVLPSRIDAIREKLKRWHFFEME
jgi:hypothetical protein